MANAVHVQGAQPELQITSTYPLCIKMDNQQLRPTADSKGTY